MLWSKAVAEKSRSYISIRKEQYENRYKEAPYIADFRNNPYTYLKTLYYIETSSIALYFLLKTKIHPNSISIFYGLLGIAGAVLLATGRADAVIIAAVIFFTKGTLDWADGPFARMTGRTSFTGYVLDDYGAFLPHLCLQIGLGFYVVQKSGNMAYFYFIPVIPFAYAANLVNYAKIIIADRSVIEAESRNIEEKESATGVPEICAGGKNTSPGFLRGVYLFIMNIFDARARGTDPICLLLVIEALSNIFVTWIVFLFIVFKNVLWFIVSMYLIFYKGVAEEELRKQIPKIGG